MFCPYVRKSYIKFAGIHYNNEQIEDGHLIIENYTNEECKKEQCGAWYEGRCRYNENND